MSIFYIGPDPFQNDLQLCILGVSPDQDMRIELYSPKKELVTSGFFRFLKNDIGDASQGYTVFYLPDDNKPANIAGQAANLEGIMAIYASLIISGPHWPYKVLNGGWTVTAGGLIMETYKMTWVKIISEAGNDDFSENKQVTYTANDQVQIQGGGLTPNQVFPVGIYYQADPDNEKSYDLFHVFSITTNARGAFTTVLHIDSTFKAGKYVAVAVTDPDYVRINHIGGSNPGDVFWVATGSAVSTPTPPVSVTRQPWMACTDAPPSRLWVGDRAYVSNDPPIPNSIRQMPGGGSLLLGKIQPGEQMEILDGPFCLEEKAWWMVRSLTTGLTGWTAEGNQQENWIPDLLLTPTSTLLPVVYPGPDEPAHYTPTPIPYPLP